MMKTQKTALVLILVSLITVVMFSGCIFQMDDTQDDVSNLVDNGVMPTMNGVYGSLEMLSVDSTDIFYPYASHSIRFLNQGNDQRYIWRSFEPYTNNTWQIRIMIDQNPAPGSQFPQFVEVGIYNQPPQDSQISSIYFQDGGLIRIRPTNNIISYTWNYNTVYTLTWSNIDFENLTADIDINGHLEQGVTLFSLPTYKPTAIGKFVINNKAWDGDRSVYFTDWTE